MEEIEAICLSFVKNTSFISFSRPLFQPFCFQLILCLAFIFIVNSNVEMFIAKALHHHIATSSRQIHYPFDSMMMRCQCYRYKDFVHFSENLCEERQREKKDKTFLFCFFFCSASQLSARLAYGVFDYTPAIASFIVLSKR